MGEYVSHNVAGASKQQQHIPCGFATNAASDPTTFYGRAIESVAHTSTGVWTVTLKSEYRRDMIGYGGLCVQLASSADVTPHFGAYDKSAGTLVIRNLTGGSLADIAADADNKIFFELIMRYGSVAEGANYDS